MEDNLSRPANDGLEQTIAHWQARLERLRAHWNFCRKHNLTLEAASLNRQHELLQNVLIDLQVALLPKSERQLEPATPQSLPQRELLFLAGLLAQAAEVMGRQVCADMEPTTRQLLSHEERDALMRQYNLWNSGEHAPGDYFLGQADAWLAFYAARFRAQAQAQPASDG
jgi:hypothetical protein